MGQPTFIEVYLRSLMADFEAIVRHEGARTGGDSATFPTRLLKIT
jgi:hypothetical protein